MDENNRGNGRVTMAILSTKLDQVIKDIGELKVDVKCLPAQKATIENMKEDIDELRKRENRNDVLLLIGTFISTGLAAIFGKKGI